MKCCEPSTNKRATLTSTSCRLRSLTGADTVHEERVASADGEGAMPTRRWGPYSTVLYETVLSCELN